MAVWATLALYYSNLPEFARLPAAALFGVGSLLALFSSHRIKAQAPLIREVFLDYLGEVNALRQQPEWYNALTGNCTTGIRGHTEPYVAPPVYYAPPPAPGISIFLPTIHIR